MLLAEAGKLTINKLREALFTVEIFKIRLDKFLAEKLPAVSRSQIQRDIEGGLVEVNGVVAMESKFVVRVGDKIDYNVVSDELRVTSLKPTNTPLKILYNKIYIYQ